MKELRENIAKALLGCLSLHKYVKIIALDTKNYMYYGAD
jgi:hypothetical protein